MVERFLGPIFEWRRTPYAMPEEQESVREALAAAMELDNDGYTIAKYLDDVAHWPDVDSELVALMDRAVHVRSEVHGWTVRAWVKANGIIPHVAVGESVIFPGYPEVVYTVVSIDAAKARYRLCRGPLAGDQLEAVINNTEAPKPLGRTQYVPFEEVSCVKTLTAQ